MLVMRIPMLSGSFCKWCLLVLVVLIRLVMLALLVGLFLLSRATCDVGFAGLTNEAASAGDDGSAGDACSCKF